LTRDENLLTSAVSRFKHEAAAIGQNFSGSKEATFYGKAIISGEDKKVLGGFILGEQPLTSTIEAVKAKGSALLALPTTIQNKVLLLRKLQSSLIHSVSCSSPHHAETLASTYDSYIEAALMTMFGISEESAQTAFLSFIFTPTEEGGLHFIPLSDLMPDFQSKVLQRITSELTKHRIVPPLIRPSISPKESWSAMRSQDYLNPSCLQISWCTALPSIPHLTMTDETYRFAARFAAGLLTQLPEDCPYLGPTTVSQMTSVDKYEHAKSCSKCSALRWRTSHEAVVFALKSFLTYQTIQTRFPLPGETRRLDKEKGGADLVVITSKQYAVDVSRTVLSDNISGSSLRAAFARKKRIYRQFAGSATMTVIPFIMDDRARISPATLHEIEEWIPWSQTPSTFMKQLCATTSVALMNGLAAGMKSRILRGGIRIDSTGEDEEMTSPPLL
jgi:hypothetical protein